MTRHGRRINGAENRCTRAARRVLACARAGAGARVGRAAGAGLPVAAAVPTSTAAPVASGPLVRGSVVTVTTGAWTRLADDLHVQSGSATGRRLHEHPRRDGRRPTRSGAPTSSANVRALVTARNAAAQRAERLERPRPGRRRPAGQLGRPVGERHRRPRQRPDGGPGTWAGVGNIYTYQWQRDNGTGFANITGATAATYTLHDADEGAQHPRRWSRADQRRRQRHGGRPNEVGPVAAAPPVNSAVPVVTGTPSAGLTLTTNAGTWSGVGQHLHLPVAARHGLRLRRHRRRDEEHVHRSSRPTPARRSASKVTATNPDGAASAYSARDRRWSPTPPVNTVAPDDRRRRRSAPRRHDRGDRHAGRARATPTPTSGSATRAPASRTSPGATTANYTLDDADLGATVRIKVTATNVDGRRRGLGRDRDGHRVAARPGRGAGRLRHAAGPARASRRRRAPGRPRARRTPTSGSATPARGFADIAGATAATYTLTDDDAGAKVRSKVIATNTDGSTAGYSGAIGPVLSTPVNTAAPEVTGTLTDASTLTASPGTWDSAGDLDAHLQVPVGPLPRGRRRRRRDGLRRPGRARRTPRTRRSPPTSAPSSPCASRRPTRGRSTATAASAVTDVLVGRALTNSVRARDHGHGDGPRRC